MDLGVQRAPRGPHVNASAFCVTPSETCTAAWRLGRRGATVPVMDPESPRLPRTIGPSADAERREAERRAQQAAALRENLKKRKAQARGRRDAVPPTGGEDPPA